MLALSLPLASCGGGGSPVEPPGEGEPLRFVDITADIGIDWTFERTPNGRHFMPDSMGAACAVFDADGDGDLDILFAHGVWGEDGPELVEHPLYLQAPDGRFERATSSGLRGGYGQGVAVGDIDADGDLDVYLSCFGPDRLFINAGDARFTDASVERNVVNPEWGASVAFFDHDVDGDLDVFVANYIDAASIEETLEIPYKDYPGPITLPPSVDVLLENDGRGYFTDVTEARGITAHPGRGLGVLPDDLDGDGRLDLYVANDGEANCAWIQQEDGTFLERALSLGLAFNGDGKAEAGMGIARGDVDGDGALDLIVTHLVLESHTLYRRRGALFVDDTRRRGLGASSIDSTGFGILLEDWDLDGDLDLAIACGRVLRANQKAGAEQVSEHWRGYAEPNQLYVWEGDRFEPAYGAFTTPVEVSRSLATGDLDGDGDSDLVLSNCSGTVRVYRNDSPNGGGWLAARLTDPQGTAIGAHVRVHFGERQLTRVLQPSRGYLGASASEVHFGLGLVDNYDEIVVTWPDGAQESFPGGAANRRLHLKRGDGN